MNKQICLSGENTGFTKKKNIRDDSCLHFRHGVSIPDQGNCITLELYFTLKLSAGEDAVFQIEFSFMFNNLVISGYTIFLLTGLRIYTGEYKAQGPTLCPTEGRALRGPRALDPPV